MLYAISAHWHYSPDGDVGAPNPLVFAVRLEDGSPIDEFGDHGIAEMPFTGWGAAILPREGGLLTAGYVRGDHWESSEDNNIYFARLDPAGTLAEAPTIRNVDDYDTVIKLLETDGGVIAACRGSDGGWRESEYLLRIP